jgi:TRAP-type C4-dicarboxylate transport system permease large subunit
LIATPILLPMMQMPVIQNFGVSPVHFGMIMLLNLGIGLCHPPVGAILFVGCAVGKSSAVDLDRDADPFAGDAEFRRQPVTYVPEISLWLPRHVLR